MSLENTRLPLIILFGPPGSGKGTQADLICNDLGALNLSIGNSVRAFIKKYNHPDSTELELALRLKQKLNSGELQDFDDVKYIVEREIKDSIAQKKNILVEGLPRTQEQAEWLAEFFRESHVDCLFFHFILPKDVVFERLSHRFFASGSDIPYSSYAVALEKCPPGKLPTQRQDDQDLNIIKHRYETQYGNCQADIIKTINSCENVQIIDIDSTATQFEIFEKLKSEIFEFSQNSNTR